MPDNMQSAPNIGFPEPDLAQAQAEKIASSGLFRNSPIQQRLIRYLVGAVLAGQGESLKEYVIAMAVFQRCEDFDARLDSIVRVQVSILRKKLAVYYNGEGVSDKVVIEIPRGHYVPNFRYGPPSGDTRCSIDLPRHEQHEAVAQSAQSESRRLTAAVCFVAVLTLGIIIGLAMHQIGTRFLPKRAGPITATGDHKGAPPDPFEWRDHPLWCGFFDHGSQTKLILGAPLIAVYPGGLLVRDITVNRLDDRDLSQVFGKIAALTDKSFELGEVYTGLGEAAGASMLSRFFQRASKDLPLVRNRLAKWHDLIEGNVIFLASRSFHTLNKQLNPPTHFDFVVAPSQPTWIHNRLPRPGERVSYTTSLNDGQNGTDYSLVSVYSSTLPGRKAMSISGSHTWGTEGAVQYITDGASLDELRRKMTEQAGSREAKTRGVQVLLKVEVLDGQVVSVRYVTHHWLP